MDVRGAAPLETLLRDAWQRLCRGVTDRRAPARHPVLATQAMGGGGEARTVVLRAASPSAGRVEIHTDALSAKVCELEAEPRATLLVWDDKARLQIRLRVTARLVHADAEAWARVPQAARGAYGGDPPPGRPIAAPEAHAPGAARERFTRLVCTIDEIELLHLGAERHRRAVYRRADGWAGALRAP
ncbi:pyridoxamine 5'-phosphate oxidase [Rhodovulum sp. 12E13]|nr:pyridoxamine 5'-phosphate oxidase [Rhodovulum sp. 12E13]